MITRIWQKWTPLFKNRDIFMYYISLHILFVLCNFLVAVSLFAAPSAVVTTESLQKLYIYPMIEAPAAVVSMNDSRISAELSARIIEIPVAIGDIVVRDAILARLNCKDYELDKKSKQVKLRRAQAAVSQARDTLNRLLKLKGGTSSAKIKQARTDRQLSELDWQNITVALEKSTLDIGKCTLRGPFTGLVLERLGKVGEFVSPGKPLIRVMDIEHIEVSAQVQTKDIKSMRTAKSLTLTYQGQRYPLKLRVVVDLLDTQTRTQEVRLAFADEHALPGTSGRLVWQQSQPHVPPDIVTRRHGKLGLLTYANQKAHFVVLKNALEGRPIPVSLPPSTRIIMDGRFNVKDGDSVKLVTAK